MDVTIKSAEGEVRVTGGGAAREDRLPKVGDRVVVNVRGGTVPAVVSGVFPPDMHVRGGPFGQYGAPGRVRDEIDLEIGDQGSSRVGGWVFAGSAREVVPVATEIQAKEYVAINSSGKAVFGPTKSYDDAKRHAGSGGHVLFVMGESAAEAPAARESFTHAQIADAATRAARGARRPGPSLPANATRSQLIAWLRWNDPNGDYSDEQTKVQGLPRLTEAEAWELVASQLEDWLTHPAARETVPVATEAGGFATSERDPAEVDRGRAMGTVTDAASVYEMLAPLYAKEAQEVFVVVPLDLRMQPLSRPVEVGRGPRDQVQVDEQMVLAPVIEHKAAAFVVCHNHPSGHADPSPADKKLTKRIKWAAAVAVPGVPMLDHVIIGSSKKGGQFYSFTEGKLYEVTH